MGVKGGGGHTSKTYGIVFLKRLYNFVKILKISYEHLACKITLENADLYNLYNEFLYSQALIMQ